VVVVAHHTQKRQLYPVVDLVVHMQVQEMEQAFLAMLELEVKQTLDLEEEEDLQLDLPEMVVAAVPVLSSLHTLHK
jgi:hypothetical protein